MKLTWVARLRRIVESIQPTWLPGLENQTRDPNWSIRRLSHPGGHCERLRGANCLHRMADKVERKFVGPRSSLGAAVASTCAGKNPNAGRGRGGFGRSLLPKFKEELVVKVLSR